MEQKSLKVFLNLVEFELSAVSSLVFSKDGQKCCKADPSQVQAIQGRHLEDGQRAAQSPIQSQKVDHAPGPIEEQGGEEDDDLTPDHTQSHIQDQGQDLLITDQDLDLHMEGPVHGLQITEEEGGDMVVEVIDGMSFVVNADSKSRSPMSNRKRHVGDRDAPPSGKCLGIFGLSLYTTEREVKEMCDRYGEVESCQIVYDHATGRSRGFAFVYFRDEESAVEAKERLNGQELDGRRIRVDFSITQRAHTPTPAHAKMKKEMTGMPDRQDILPEDLTQDQDQDPLQDAGKSGIIILCFVHRSI
eukprot:gene3207-3683_t